MPLAAVILALMLQGPVKTPTQGPVTGSVACQACHAPEFEKWSNSIHGKMIQRANRNTIVSKSDQSGGPATAKLWQPDEIAQEIIEGILKNKFAIAPGLELSLLNRLRSLLFPGLNWYFDRVVQKNREGL